MPQHLHAVRAIHNVETSFKSVLVICIWQKCLNFIRNVGFSVISVQLMTDAMIINLLKNRRFIHAKVYNGCDNVWKILRNCDIGHFRKTRLATRVASYDI